MSKLSVYLSYESLTWDVRWLHEPVSLSNEAIKFPHSPNSRFAPPILVYCSLNFFPERCHVFWPRDDIIKHSA
jgi:hypothetical protein